MEISPIINKIYLIHCKVAKQVFCQTKYFAVNNTSVTLLLFIKGFNFCSNIFSCMSTLHTDEQL